MATKHVLFVFLLVVGLVASQFNDCNVNEEQNIKIANCTLAPKNVTKGVGQCHDDIIMANIAASMTWHAIAPRDDKIHEAAEEAIQEEVQFIPVELLLRLKPEEKHDI